MILVGLISMVPIIELRGAIPYAVLWDAQPLWLAILIAVIGNMIPVPFIYLFARKILVWGADKPVIGKFFSFCLEKGEKGGKKLQEKAGQGLFVALLLFVGIPLPEPVRGQEPLQPVSLTWDSRKVSSPAWAVFW